MVSAGISTALDFFEQRWRKKGYTLLRNPLPESLPEFFGRFRPDAIAVGPKPSLVVQVARQRSKGTDVRLEDIQSLLDNRKGWQLVVLYGADDGTALEPVSSAVMASAIHRMAALASIDPGAALIVGWAALEATARQLEPILAARSLSVGSLLDLLVSMGHLDDEDSRMLSPLGRMRHAIAHGQLDQQPEPADLERLQAIVEALQAWLAAPASGRAIA